MTRFRYYGDLCWMRREGVPFVLAVGSRWICRYLTEHGFSTVEAYFGYQRDWGSDLGLHRDIPVLWIGKPGSRRRARLLTRIRSELGSRKIDIRMVDGIENPYVFGCDRTRLLNRTKIVLNLLRAPWDNNAFRYYLAASNRALIVTEPTLTHTPFKPGVHLVEAPINRIVDVICYWLDHETERKKIADQAYYLITQQLTLETAICRISESVASLRGSIGLPMTEG